MFAVTATQKTLRVSTTYGFPDRLCFTGGKYTSAFVGPKKLGVTKNSDPWFSSGLKDVSRHRV